MKKTLNTTNTTVKHEAQVTRPAQSVKAGYQAEQSTEKARIIKGAFGDYAESLAKGGVTYSKSAMVDTCKVSGEIVENFYNDCAQLMGKIGVMMDAREAAKGNPEKDSPAALMLDNAERSVKKLAESLFYSLAYRKGRSHKNKAGEWVTDKDPFYKVRYADYAIFGEMLEQSKAGAESNRIERFTGLFLLFAGRILTGKPAGRVSANDLREARKAAKDAAADKAMKTRKTRKTDNDNKEESADVKAVKAELEARSSLVASVIASASEKVNASHATDEEKAEIIALLESLVK